MHVMVPRLNPVISQGQANTENTQNNDFVAEKRTHFIKLPCFKRNSSHISGE